MKKAALLLSLLIAFISCDFKQSAESKENEIATLKQVIAYQDSVINDVFYSINIISQNLEAIKRREQLITTSPSEEIGLEKRAQIIQDIAAIDKLIQENRATVQHLTLSANKLRYTGTRIQELENFISTLTNNINDKDADISELKKELVELNLEIADLYSSVGELSSELSASELLADKIIEEMTLRESEFNTVHYIIGPERELLSKGILKKSGIIGRTLLLNNEYNMNDFVNVMKNDLDKVMVGHKKAKIITTHPPDSYSMEMNDKSGVEAIVIENKDRFWETSKVLVISYK